jgi:outer membrane protein assembly factor BamD (BamD/ComL family)
LENAGRLVKERRYAEALATYCKIAKESPASERGASALFACASVRAFYDNPQRDYGLALQEFDEFLQLYPNNEKAGEAQNWRSVLKVVIDLKRENEHLTTSIEQLNQLDIRQEERRRR